jgi:hypothetical protein
MKTPLYESGRGTANASGVATVTIGPRRAFEKWQVTRVAVQSTSSVLVPTCRLYRGAAVASRLIDGTYTGTLDSTDLSLTLQSGEDLVAEWSGCDVGATCTVTVDGEAVR